MAKMNEELNLTEHQQQRIDKCLETLLIKTKAYSVIFSDATGQLIGKAGVSDDRNAQALSALSIGSFAATSEMARFLGRITGFNQSFHVGGEIGIYSSTVQPSYLLTVPFGAETRLGLVRIFVNKAVGELERIIEEARANRINDERVEKIIDTDFARQLTDELDALFPNE